MLVFSNYSIEALYFIISSFLEFRHLYPMTKSLLNFSNYMGYLDHGCFNGEIQTSHDLQPILTLPLILAFINQRIRASIL